MVAARTDKNAAVSHGMTFFWVPTNTPGISFIPNRMIALEFGGNCQTHFDNVRVPETHLIGEVNKGYSIIESFFLAHLPGASGLLGSMQRVYEDMRTYCAQRVGGGKPLIQHSSIASKLGELAVSLESSRALFYKGAWEIDQMEKQGGKPLGESNLFWFLASYALFKQVSWRFCEIASDVYGGISSSLDMPVAGLMNHLFYVRSAGLTFSTELMKAGWEYDGRYQSK